MLTRDFNYDLPSELIAQRPAARRSGSRLLCLDGATGALEDRRFAELPGLLGPGDLLVMNNTRVIPARVRGKKETGGRIELLVERIVDARTALVQVRASKRPRPGGTLVLDGDVRVTVLERRGEFWCVQFPAQVEECLEKIGHLPLPPYIDRQDDLDDRERYQTVYATRPGAVAAPTAGLHFDQPLLDRLSDAGTSVAFVTLHVGAGTFQPVRAEAVTDHRMHAERVTVPEETVDSIRRTREAGGRVVAVGTTVVRSLESASQNGSLRPFDGESRLFIYPGYVFHAVDVLVTNFHLPQSSLLMMVSAFGGFARIMAAYRHAIARQYRFFSYGDAMLVSRNPAPDLPPSSDAQT